MSISEKNECTCRTWSNNAECLPITTCSWGSHLHRNTCIYSDHNYQTQTDTLAVYYTTGKQFWPMGAVRRATGCSTSAQVLHNACFGQEHKRKVGDMHGITEMTPRKKKKESRNECATREMIKSEPTRRMRTEFLASSRCGKGAGVGAGRRSQISRMQACAKGRITMAKCIEMLRFGWIWKHPGRRKEGVMAEGRDRERQSRGVTPCINIQSPLYLVECDFDDGERRRCRDVQKVPCAGGVLLGGRGVV